MYGLNGSFNAVFKLIYSTIKLKLNAIILYLLYQYVCLNMQDYKHFYLISIGVPHYNILLYYACTYGTFKQNMACSRKPYLFKLLLGIRL